MSLCGICIDSGSASHNPKLEADAKGEDLKSEHDEKVQHCGTDPIIFARAEQYLSIRTRLNSCQYGGQ